ncbi:MAG: hypothetical protein E7262_02465 [Lachnospiraceae bacterium]|nr:hypothetical protein [Lachnospiraceae bacterium]
MNKYSIIILQLFFTCYILATYLIPSYYSFYIRLFLFIFIYFYLFLFIIFYLLLHSCSCIYFLLVQIL